MRFIKQPHSLKIKNIYIEPRKVGLRHGNLLPNTVRCLISGPSNCGKTNLIIGLLLHKNGLHYSNVYVYSKTIDQPKYLFLEKVLRTVPEISFTKYIDNEDVLNPQQAAPNSVIIFDDVACENQNNIRDYFALGRHRNIDCFYLNQTYTKIPKQLVRDNANLLVIFKQDDVNLKHIYDEHVNTDMPWNLFREICGKIWNASYNFLVINKDCVKNGGRYRKNFDTFIILD